MNPMTLGTYAFERNPKQYTIPGERRVASVVETYGGIGFFSWGMMLAGQVITLEWPLMTATMFNSLSDLLDDDEGKVWTPTSGEAYNVQMMKLEGKYVEGALLDAPYREDVTLELVIVSEV